MRTRVSRDLRISGLILAVVGAVAGVAEAQAAQTGGGAPSVAQQVPPVQAQANAPKPPKSGGACPFAGHGSVTLTKVTVTGATRISQPEIDGALAGLLGRPADFSAFCIARDRIAALYVRKGFKLTRVDLPPQEVKRGELILLATEGYIADVGDDHLARMGPSAGLARAMIEPLADPAKDAKPGAAAPPTPWSRIERAVLLARDIPGADFDIRLHAAPTPPGALEMVAVASPRRRFDLSAGLQDMGSKELGQVAGYLRLDANSFTPFGERTSLLYYGTTTGAQKVGEFTESAFIGASGLRAALDITYARTEPRGRLATLSIAGDFFNGAFDLSFPLVRGAAFNLGLDTGLEIINERNSLGALRGAAGTPLLFKDKLRIFHARGNLEWLPDAVKYLTVTGDVELRQGIVGLNSSKAGDANLSRASGDPGAFEVRANAVARWTFGQREIYEQAGRPWIQVSGHIQHSDQSLLAYEQFQIGNFTVGRGFDPGAASGDSAYGVQVEAGAPIRFGPKDRRLAVEPYAFYDSARLENHVGYSVGVSSFGLGARAWLPANFRLDAAFAEPLTAPFPGAPKSGGRLLASITFVHSFR